MNVMNEDASSEPPTWGTGLRSAWCLGAAQSPAWLCFVLILSPEALHQLPLLSVLGLCRYLSVISTVQSQNVSLLEMTAWRITWAAFSHRRKRPERSGGLSKITGLLRGPLETRTEFCYSCCRGNCTLHFWPFLFHSGAFTLTAEEISLDEVFFSFFLPVCFICYLFLIAKFDFNFIY